jgi:catechol 2,3-dioxygenase-like lactoylglutathione lyase family enzyme
MRSMVTLFLCGLFWLAGASNGSAQLTAAKAGPVVYGHHHLIVTSVEAHKRFWVDTLGGVPTPFGSGELFKFPNVLVLVREGEPSGGTKGTTVNHLGFGVPSVRAVVDKARAAGYSIATRDELSPTMEVTDGVAYIANQDTYIAYVMAPDNVKVEFVENKTQNESIALHHIHFAGPVDEMQAWYVETFGAVAGTRGSFKAADLPGVNLTYSRSAEPLQGTQGRSLDHIGFEVDGLEEFCKKLELLGITFDRPYRKLDGRNLAIAFFTDPFGTYIELTEGLDEL